MTLTGVLFHVGLVILAVDWTRYCRIPLVLLFLDNLTVRWSERRVRRSDLYVDLTRRNK